MSKHERYKEHCALASLGELPATDLGKLRRHLRACAACREVYTGFERINAALLTEITEDDETINRLEASTRAAVVEGIASVDQQEPVLHIPPLPQPQPQPWRFAWVTAGLTAAVVVSFALGVQYEFHHVGAEEAGRLTLRIPVPAAPATIPLPSIQSAEGNLRVALDNEHHSNTVLRGSLEQRGREYEEALTQNIALRERVAAQERELATARSQLGAKSIELKEAQDASASDKTTLVAAQYQLQELAERFNSEQSALQRERDLLAKGKEIRDIVGARNLHIVDVYDADPAGHTKRAFARAFYTEGKSLVFYAYDLPAQHGDAKLTYVAWGQKNGHKSSIRNLGILVNDDQGQKRWSLNLSDSKTLAEIDSVFITLEPAGDAGSPKGKRMLTAYLNDAVNHP